MTALVGAVLSLQVTAIHSTDAQNRPAPPSAQERTAFARAQSLQAGGQSVEAADALDRFLANYPHSVFRAEAQTLLGHIRLEQKDYKQAVTLLSEVVKQEPESDYIDRARLDLATAYLALNRKKAAAVLLDTIATSKAAPGLRRQAYDWLATLATEEGNTTGAIRWLMKERDLPDDVVDRDAIATQVANAIAQAQDPTAMEALADEFQEPFPAADALLRAAQLYGVRGEWFHQERTLLRFLASFPQDVRGVEARIAIEAGRTRLRALRVAIGVPLPYGGALQPYAVSLLRGAQLAVEQGRAGMPDSSIGLVVKDYGADSSRLGAVVDELIREYRCVAMIGPVLTREAAVVVPRAQQARVPLVSPSLSGPVASSRFLFRMALTASAEGAAVAQYASQRLGLRRFAVLAPRDRYSEEVVASFAEEVARQGGRLVFSGAYDGGAVDFGKDINALKESDLQQEGLMETPEPDPTVPPGIVPTPIYVPGFDAVFLPGDGATAGLIAAQLRFHDIALPLLGTSGWNGRELIASGGRYVEDAVFVDTFFANAQDPVVQQFVAQFKARYREEPDAFAAQAYDATRLILQALKTGASGGDQLRDALASITGFHGVSGVTGFDSQGEVLRRLSWIQVRNGRFIPAL